MGVWIALSALGGFMTVEATAVGQFMLSRPIVTGLLAGWIVGSPMTGFAVGALLEVYLLVAFPVGGARFPEGSPATIVAVAGALAVPASGTGAEAGGALAIAVAIGLVWGQLCGFAATLARRVNGRLLEPGMTSGARLERRHFMGIAIEFTRGAIMTFAGVVLARGVASRFAGEWPLDASGTWSVLLLGGIVSVGILMRSFGGIARRRVLFGVGLAIGLAGAFLQ